MSGSPKKSVFAFVVCFVLHFICLPTVSAQKVLGYGPDERTAKAYYDECLHGVYQSWFDTLPEYPVKGAYSATHYSNLSRSREYSKVYGLPVGVGHCTYIYIPTQDTLRPGHQYRISLTVKVSDAFAHMPYFQSHFGVALSSELYPKTYMGLWIEHFVHLNIETTKKPVTIEFVFRPLCTSQYLLLGVFQGATNDTQSSDLSLFGFDLHHLMVEEWDDPEAEFVYLCNAFAQGSVKTKGALPQGTDTVYFDSGSAEILEKDTPILDSIPSKLSYKQSLITLSAYTDIEGSDNVKLGMARNEAVRNALAKRGVDTAQVLLINHGESQASHRISQEDRRVEISVNTGMLFEKFYTEAKEAATAGAYGVAQAKMKQWLKFVPPENAIYALFDCWGEGEKATLFKRDLVRNIRAKFYKADDLKFTLDSLHCEDQIRPGRRMYGTRNSLKGYQNECVFEGDSLSEIARQGGILEKVDEIYSEHGFPSVEEVGSRGNQTLPYLLIHAGDTTFQKRYLPLVKKACEEQLLSWEYYATLYDKICLVRNGHQRFGTQLMADETGRITGRYPFEDESLVAEYRKQVGLAPLSDF
jgi:hypothetical protein